MKSDNTKIDDCEEIQSKKFFYKSKLARGICPTHFSISFGLLIFQDNLLNLENGSAGLKYSQKQGS